MKTIHKIYFSDSGKMDAVSSESIDLVVTSPPYPMIQMWDDMFCAQNPSITAALENGEGSTAFELMHLILDPIWKQVHRVLKFGGFACINIGDATRTIGENFGLYPNHMRILKYLLELGLNPLPDILWRKQTNAPNKFMGSGMLPAGAYVTLEHEYILIVRKGPKREFKREAQKENRRQSAIFWEERNIFYSDIWFDIKGTTQFLKDKEARLRSAAYPFELAYRLVNMYSAKGDTILDPFLGTGTTSFAAMASGRNSIGYEKETAMRSTIHDLVDRIVPFSNEYIRNRLLKHIDFVMKRISENGELKHKNRYYGFPVMTLQEKELILNELLEFGCHDNDTFELNYSQTPQKAFCRDWPLELASKETDRSAADIVDFKAKKNSGQMKLF